MPAAHLIALKLLAGAFQLLSKLVALVANGNRRNVASVMVKFSLRQRREEADGQAVDVTLLECYAWGRKILYTGLL
jgi:hypothetical protein